VEIEKLGKINKALEDTEAKFGKAMVDAGTDKGQGDDGKLPGSRYKRDLTLVRISRADGEGCTAVKSGWEKFNKSADATAKSAGERIDDTNADATIAALDAINKRSTLVEDLKSCDKSASRQGVIVSIVYIRVYVFWCIYWRRVVIVVRIQILVIQFQLPNPIASTTALPATVATNAPASTAAPSGRNKHFREKWLSALKGKM